LIKQQAVQKVWLAVFCCCDTIFETNVNLSACRTPGFSHHQPLRLQLPPQGEAGFAKGEDG